MQKQAVASASEADHFLDRAPRVLFFTGKGGVGKTSVACATALALAERGKRVLLVSTDPASNLDEVLQTQLGSNPRLVSTTQTLYALNIDPEAAAHAYREKMVGPYRGVLPEAAVRSIEEQLSGACTVEIAAFDEFSKLLGDTNATRDYDHVVFDTAPTGHTLRLLALPAAWTGFLEDNVGGVSCLGPLAGLKSQQSLYAASHAALIDATHTVLVLVARAERSALREAERTHVELKALGIERQELVINGIFHGQRQDDVIAVAMEQRAQLALDAMPSGLATLRRTDVPLLPFGLVGLDALRALFEPSARAAVPLLLNDVMSPIGPSETLASLIPAIEASGHGVIMTMGKGGVGKTTVAVNIAVELARRGHPVLLTTTDPAAHVVDALGEPVSGEPGYGEPVSGEPGYGEPVSGLRVSRIDPVAETKKYTDEVLQTTGAALDSAGRALLEEDLRSPCTEEIAVFRAFAKIMDEGANGFVVLDTAPTGHTLLLLDAAESYHREVLRKAGQAPEEVRRLLPRLRDPLYTKILLVTLPEATPVHEAAQLQRDLARAGIVPFAWVINQSLVPWQVTDPVLVQRRANEGRFHHEVRALSTRAVLVPWTASQLVQPGHLTPRLDLVHATSLGVLPPTQPTTLSLAP